MIRVVVAEDTPLFRGALTVLLRREDDIDVVAEVSQWRELSSTVRRTGADVVVLDMAPADNDPLTEALALCRISPRTRTLILVEADGHDVLVRTREAELSSVGFLTKNASPDHLISAVRGLAAGAPIIDPHLVASILTSAGNPLTGREQDVLRLAAEGAPVKEIANRLFLSAGTVRNCLSRINLKIGANNRIQAIRRAQQAGWL